MENSPATDPAPLCPSARPEMEGSILFGVVGGSVDAPRVGYLDEPLEVTPELLGLSGAIPPTEVFRFAAPCAAARCQHFDGANCRLAQRTVRLLPMAVDRLPACRLRPRCRWWLQEGKAACLRCPAIVTDNHAPTPWVRRAATPRGD
jgi:hypothetical protein